MEQMNSMKEIKGTAENGYTDSSMQLSAFLQCLPAWFEKNKRELPWRSDPAPYHVWLSEIMLQQTRVEAVKGYYGRFLTALPDLQALAEAPEDVILKLWEGLGYYNRIRNMQKAARQVTESGRNQLPGTKEELLQLPGIGSYTAGAIASIAFGRRETAVDGNVLRVLSRIRCDARVIDDQKVRTSVEEELMACYPEKGAGNLNQALMDLGAMVWIPNGRPLCDQCPAAWICQAHRQGTETDYPVRKAKAARKDEDRTVLLLQDAGLTALRKRPANGLLAGMYEFPCLDGHADRQQVIEYLKELELQPIRITALQEAEHIFTHKVWHMTGYRIRVDELEPVTEKAAAEGIFFAETGDIHDKYAIPSAYSVYLKYLNS